MSDQLELEPEVKAKMMKSLNVELEQRPTVDLAVRQWIDARTEKAKELGTLVAEVHELTPQLARELLRLNPGNRSIRPSKLGQYRADIMAGKWQLNGESIIIAANGMLNDGQHRCKAVVDAERSIEAVFVFGATNESRMTLDSGAYRSPADHLQFEGVKYSGAVAGITRFILAHENKTLGGLGSTNRVSATAVVERSLEDTAIQDIAQWVYRQDPKKTKRLASPSVIGFCLYSFKKKNAAEAYAFLDSIIRGVNLDAHDPAYIIRETLMDNETLSREQRIDLLFRGWNAFRTKTPVNGSTRKVDKMPALK